MSSEIHYRELFENASDIVYTLDLQGNLTSVNRAGQVITGYTPQELLGRSIASIVAPEYLDRMQAMLEKKMAGDPLSHYDLEILTRDGRRLALEVSSRLIYEAGRPVGIQGIARDVTYRRKAEEEREVLLEREKEARIAAQEAERRLGFLAEASGILAGSLDYEATLASVARLAVPQLADGCVVDIVGDDGVLRRLAYAHADPEKLEWAREVQRRYPLDPNAPYGAPQVVRECRAALLPEITDAMLEGAARDAEHLRLLRSIGMRSIMIVPLEAHGRAVGALTFVSAESGRRYGPADLAYASELARRAAVAVENSRLYSESQAANRAKDEFLATVSHELRTPLNAILGWTRMLRSGALDPATAERALETIERNARAQTQLVDDLLDVSRIVSGKLRLEVRPVELAPVVHAAIDAVRLAAEAKAIQIHTALDLRAGPVAGDPDRLQQIVWNLLSNAIKFTPREGRIDVRLVPADAGVEIAVSDTGIGIRREFLPYVFERFRQADAGTTRTFGGLGLGLAIVRHLAELHGGAVEAESAGEGKGSTFTLRLPLLTGAPQPSAVERTAAAAAAVTRPLASLAGLRLLVVDDDPETVELVQAMLQSFGAEVRSAPSASAAVAALDAWIPHVLISDIEMPGEDGYALVRKVRMLPRDRGGGVPAVALTAYARSEDRSRALAAGFDVHLTKPVDPAALAAAVARVARLSAAPAAG